MRDTLKEDSPVNADGTQVEDGGGAQHDVHGHQSVTNVCAQGPDATQKLDTAEKYTLNV